MLGWIAVFVFLAWILEKLNPATGGWYAVVSGLILAISFSFLPPLYLVKLACGRFSTLDARWRKLMETRKAQRSGRTSGESVRDWSLFTKLLVIGFFAFPLMIAALFLTSGSFHWGVLLLGASGLVIPGIVIYLWFFQQRPPAAPDPLRLAMRSLVEERIATLKGLDRSPIEALVPLKREDVVTPHGKVVLCTYHDVLPDASHRVVAQAIRQPRIGWAVSVEVEGFVLTEAGGRRGITEEESWEFT